MRKYAPYVLLGIVIGILAYAIALWRSTAPSDEAAESATPAAVIAPAPDAVIGGQTEAAPSGTYPKIALPYVESGYRFQFSGCHGTPGSLVVKAGKYFLLDNRDAKAITIAVAGQSYKIGAYSAAVAAVWKVGTHQITCNGGGAASLTVQK